MLEPLDDNQKSIIEKAVRQFIDAQLDGQTRNIDEFAKQYPGLEEQIRRRIRNLQEIDGLFADLMQPGENDLEGAGGADNLIGHRLGDFEILSLIGTGGMGAVFLARQLSLDRDVALKVITDISGVRGKSLERFKREAKVLAKVSHPNIVPIYEVGQDGPYSYFAMEYVKGTSLDRILSAIRDSSAGVKASQIMQDCLDGKELLRRDTAQKDAATKGAEIDTAYIVNISKIIISIASALEYAHERGILHRDIKPSNILIDADATPKLVDFGLARSETQQTITVTGEFFGTPSYVSPEQIRKPETVDCRSDVYSLGAAFYECLTLHPPFEGDTVNETLTRVISREAVPPKKYCPRLSADLNTVLLHALEKSPDDRYGSAAYLAADIENVLDFRPITAKRPSITRRAYKTLRRNPLRIGIVVVSILLIVLGYFLFSDYMQKRDIMAAKRLHRYAAREMMTGKYEKAIEFYEESIRRYPLDAEAHLEMGTCYQQLKQYSKAIEAYKKALTIDPDYTMALAALAGVYRLEGSQHEATAIYQRIARINPNDSRALNDLGVAYDDSARYGEAVKVLEKAISIDPNNAYAHSNLGLAYGKLGRYEESIQAFLRSIEISPSIVLVHTNLSKALNSMGRFQEAIDVARQAIRMDPNNANAHCDLGDAYRDSGRLEEAVAAYKQAIEIDPDNFFAYNNLGLAYSDLRRHQDALQALRHAIGIDPDNGTAHSNLGLVYSDLGRLTEAIETLKHAIEIDPQNAMSYYNLGTVYNMLKRYAEALQAFDQAIRIKPNDIRTGNNMAISFEGLGRYEEAEKAYKEATKIEPDNALCYNNIGIFYGRLGRYEEAIESLKQAIRIDPNDAVTVTNLARAYNYLKRYEEAIQVCEQVAGIDPSYAAVYNELGIANIGLMRHEEAIRCHKRAVEIDPNNISAFGYLALTYTLLDRHEETIQICKSLISINPNNAAGEFAPGLLGSAYGTLRHYEAAINCFKWVCKLTDYRNHLYIAALAFVCAESGDFDKAIEYQQKAIDLADDDAKAEYEYEKRLTEYKANRPWRQDVSR